MEKEREKMMPAARRSVTAVAAREGREAATAEEELDEACDEGWRQRLRQRLRDLAGAEEEEMGRRGWRRSSAIETLLGRTRWPQRERFRRRKQEGEPPMKMTTAAFLGDRGGGQRWERWWAMTGEVEGFLAFDGSGGSRETEKRGRAGEGGHGGRGGGRDDERR